MVMYESTPPPPWHPIKISHCIFQIHSIIQEYSTQEIWQIDNWTNLFDFTYIYFSVTICEKIVNVYCRGMCLSLYYVNNQF